LRFGDTIEVFPLPVSAPDGTEFLMLVLTRKVSELVVIGGNIRITIISTAGGKVRIGIDAPRDIKIVREELLAGPAVQACLVSE
jgi:carbon storage regulator